MNDQFDIYLDDLKPDVQQRYLAELGLKTAKEANLDVFPLASLPLEGPETEPVENHENHTFKVYSPLKGTLCAEYDFDGGDELDDFELTGYVPEIRAMLQNENSMIESTRGLMEYYGKQDGVNEKVISAWTDVEVYDDRLWGVTVCELREPLTEKEKDALCGYLRGQYSDGFGEGFEQQCIKVSGGELSVHLWNDGPHFRFIEESELIQERPARTTAPKKKAEKER